MGTFPVPWNNSVISAALDPSGAYQHCTLAYPSTTILNNRLYMDAGETRMMVGDSPHQAFYETNPRILWIDLSQPFDYANYTINSRKKPETVPSLAGGSAFAYSPNNSQQHPKFFRFGGYYPLMNETAIHYEPAPEHMDQVGLTWSYDAVSEAWTREQSAGILTGLQAGAATTNSFTNEGYFLGGFQDDWILDKSPQFWVGGMVTLNMVDASWRNNTIPGPGISGALMEYLPIGKKGVLVVFGGMTFPEGRGVPDDTPGIPYPMEVIRIYDVDSRTWLSQNASGAAGADVIPDGRLLGCTALASAPDNSSYNIYLFGGQRQVGGDRTKDLWILSLPSFTWIKVADDTTGGVGHSCPSVGRQMFVIGSESQDETTCQPFFRVLDMATLQWTNMYDPQPPAYGVPPVVYAAVGGDEMGGAKVIAPPNDSTKGGDWTELNEIFAQTPWGANTYLSGGKEANSPSTTASSTPTDGSLASGTSPTLLSGAEIAGIVFGMIISVALLVSFAVLWWKRWRASARASRFKREKKTTIDVPVVRNDQQDRYRGELQGEGVILEMATPRDWRDGIPTSGPAGVNGQDQEHEQNMEVRVIPGLCEVEGTSG